MPIRPREPNHNRRTGHVPGVSSTIKTIRAPHEQPVGRPTQPRAGEVIIYPKLHPAKGGSAPPAHFQQLATRDVGDFAPSMAGADLAGSGAAFESAAFNLLSNGGFESDLASPASGWSIVSGAMTVQGTVASVAADVTEGNNFATVTLPATASSWSFQSELTTLPEDADAIRLSADLAVRTWNVADASVVLFGTMSMDAYDSTGSLVGSLTIDSTFGFTYANLGLGYANTSFLTAIPTGFDIAAVKVKFSFEITGVLAHNIVLGMDNVTLVPSTAVDGYFTGSADFDTVRVEENLMVIGGKITGPGSCETGTVVMWASSAGNIPTGWQLCDGTALDRIVYADLYALIGVTYGAGDGLTTFNVPNLQNNFPLGASGTIARGTAAGSTDYTHQHNMAGTSWAKITMPTGSGQIVQSTASGVTGWTDDRHGALTVTVAAGSSRTSATDIGGQTNTGGVQQRPPYLALNFMIKT